MMEVHFVLRCSAQRARGTIGVLTLYSRRAAPARTMYREGFQLPVPLCGLGAFS